MGGDFFSVLRTRALNCWGRDAGHAVNPSMGAQSRHRPPWMAGMPEMQEHFPAMWLMALQRATENTPDGTSSCHGVAGLVGIYQDGSRPERRSWNSGPRTMSDMDVAIEPPWMGSR